MPVPTVLLTWRHAPPPGTSGPLPRNFKEKRKRGRVQRNTKRGSQMRPHTHSENRISIWRSVRVEVNSEAEKLHWWVAFGPQRNCLQVLHRWILAIYQHFFTPCFLLPHNPSLFIGGRWNTRSVSKKRWEQAIDKNSYFMHFKFIGLILFYQTKHFTCILFFNCLKYMVW